MEDRKPRSHRRQWSNRSVCAERTRLAVEDLDLPNTTVVLKKHGEEVASATGAAVLGDPARTIAWLANKLAGYHRSLKAGEIVLPNSMTPIYPFGAAHKVEAVSTRWGACRSVLCRSNPLQTPRPTLP